MLDQALAHRVNVVHFQTKMMNPLAPDFLARLGLEKFDELVGRDLQIKPEQLAVLEKIEMPFQAQRAAVKIQGAVQVFRDNAEVSECFDHIVANYKSPRAESNVRNEINFERQDCRPASRRPKSIPSAA